jgi:hypothetical protein
MRLELDTQKTYIESVTDSLVVPKNMNSVEEDVIASCLSIHCGSQRGREVMNGMCKSNVKSRQLQVMYPDNSKEYIYLTSAKQQL